MNRFAGGFNCPGRTYQHAEMASHAFARIKMRSSFLVIKADCLMAAIHTGDIASAAAIAALMAEDRENNHVTFNIRVGNHGG